MTGFAVRVSARQLWLNDYVLSDFASASVHPVMKLPRRSRNRLPERWIRRRSRMLRHARYQAVQRIGLATAGSPQAGETTLCMAYLCPWAHSCPAATDRPALVGQRNCQRLYPVDLRPPSGLSDHALDTLAFQRAQGERLGAVTIAALDQFRPAGPSPSIRHKRPRRPVYQGRVRGRGTTPKRKAV